MHITLVTDRHPEATRTHWLNGNNCNTPAIFVTKKFCFLFNKCWTHGEYLYTFLTLDGKFHEVVSDLNFNNSDTQKMLLRGGLRELAKRYGVRIPEIPDIVTLWARVNNNSDRRPVFLFNDTTMEWDNVPC